MHKAEYVQRKYKHKYDETIDTYSTLRYRTPFDKSINHGFHLRPTTRSMNEYVSTCSAI